MNSILPSATTRRKTFTPSKFRRCLAIAPLWPALVVLLSGPVLAAPPPAPEGPAAPRTAALSQSGQAVVPKQQFARTINIDMGSKAFSVTSIKVNAGESVRFVLRNTSSSPHEFTVGTPDMQRFRRRFMKRVTEGNVIKSSLEKINPSERQQLESWNAVVVLPGESRELLWTFDKTQSIEFGCNIHGHYEAGMKGQFHASSAVDKKADFHTANGLDFPGVRRAAEVKATGSQTPSRVSKQAVQKADQPANQKARKPILLTVRDHQRMAKMRKLWLASRTLNVRSKRRDPVVLTNFNSDRNVGRYHDKRGFVVARKDIHGQNVGAAESVAAALSSAVTAVFSSSDAVDDEGASDTVGSTRIRRAGFAGNNGEGGRGGNGSGDGGGNGGNGGGNGGNGGGNGGNGGGDGGDGGDGGGDGGDGGEGGGDGGEGGEGGGDGGEGGGDGGEGGDGGGDD